MRRPVALALAAALALAGCGGGSSATSTTVDPAAADAASASHVVLHAYDFPAGWTPVENESPSTRFDLLEQANGCLKSPLHPRAKAENYWMQSYPVAVRSLTAVAADDATAQAALKELSGDAFKQCFQQRVFDFIKKTLPPEQLQPTMLVDTSPVTLGVNGIDYEMRATPITPGGPSAYIGFVFLQNGRLVSMLNFFSTSAFPPAIQGALVRSVADRMH